MASDASNNNTEGTRGKNVLEWAVVAVGVAITLGLIGFLVVQMLTGSTEPASFRIALGTPRADSSTVLVPVKVANDGGEVASDVEVEVCGADGRCASVTFRYIPRQSVRTGEVGFEAPAPDALAARIVSYVEP